MNRLEGFFLGFEKTKLYFQVWEPKEPPKAVLTITHGQSEHSDCYHRLADAIVPQGIKMIAWDLRGHGRSAGPRGHAPEFEAFVRDYEYFIRVKLEELRPKGVPLFHLAHSLGGLIHLKYFLSEPDLRDRNQIFSSPLLGLALPIEAPKSFLTKMASQVLAQLVPSLHVGNDLALDFLSRDPEVIAEFRKDPLRHMKISSTVYFEALELMESIPARASQLSGNCLFLLPEKDPVVSTPKTVEFYKKIPDGKKKLNIYKGRRHELFNDLGREEVYQDLMNFLLSPKK